MKTFWLVLFGLLWVSYGFAGKLTLLQNLMKPGVIETDGEKIYILDGVTVDVYSLKDYRLLVHFGKAGQGPGELALNEEIPIQMVLVNDHILLSSQLKMIYFTKEGKPIKEKSFPNPALQILPIGGNFAMSRIGFVEGGGFTFKVTLYDAELKEIKSLYTIQSSKSSQGKRKLVVPPEYIFIYSGGDRLYVVGDQEKFLVNIFEPGGKELSPIEMEYSPIEFSDSLKARIKEDLRVKNVPPPVREMLFFPDLLPVIRDVKIDDNKVYIQTYKTEKNLSEFFIFDFTGKLLKKVFLPQPGGDAVKLNTNHLFTIHKKKYYYLIENLDEEAWELHVENIDY